MENIIIKYYVRFSLNLIKKFIVFYFCEFVHSTVSGNSNVIPFVLCNIFFSFVVLPFLGGWAPRTPWQSGTATTKPILGYSIWANVIHSVLKCSCLIHSLCWVRRSPKSYRHTVYTLFELILALFSTNAVVVNCTKATTSSSLWIAHVKINPIRTYSACLH